MEVGREATEPANGLVTHAAVALVFHDFEQPLGRALVAEATDAVGQLNAQASLARGIRERGPKLVQRGLTEDTPFQYRVVAEWGKVSSAPSASAPPELPGLSAASVWSTSSISRPDSARMLRPSALTIPAVTVC